MDRPSMFEWRWAMSRGPKRIYETTDQIRAGMKVPGMTTVLFVSIGLAAIVLAAVCLF
jgi:hypothetical protein